MSSVNEAIAFALTTSHQMYDSFLADFSPSDYLHRVVPKSNCAAWTTGHLVLTERRALSRLRVSELPRLPDQFETRFARDETAPSAWDFGDVTVLRPLFAEHRQKLIAAVRAASPEELDQPLDRPTGRFKTVGEMVHFMALHVIMHAGQLSTIRRSLGRPPLV